MYPFTALTLLHTPTITIHVIIRLYTQFWNTYLYSLIILLFLSKEKKCNQQLYLRVIVWLGVFKTSKLYNILKIS